ncbi:hypothetical protein [Leucobacter sp. GX24907]
MSQESGKRSAVEPPAALLATQSVSLDAKRPGSLAGGAALIVLRSIGGIFWIIGLLAEWPSVSAKFEFDDVTSLVLLWLLLCVEGIWIGSLLLFAWLLWRGSNLARMLAMFWAAASITASAVAYFATGEQITVRTTLLTLALDILLMLALSSRDARAWTRGRKQARREAREGRLAERIAAHGRSAR